MSDYIFNYILIIMLGTKLYMLIPVPGEISIIPTYITLDIILYSLIGIHLILRNYDYKYFLKIIPIIIITLILKPTFILNIYNNTGNEFPKIDISDITLLLFSF